jgi:hypothetical protein
MPLVLSMQQNQDFFVGDARFVLTDILSATQCRLRRMSDRRDFDIDDRKATEIDPEVLVSTGEWHSASKIRIAINAPRHILVLRGDMWRSQAAEARV